MGCCSSKDDIEEERIYFPNEKYGEEDIRELGVCVICKNKNILVSFYLDHGCLCKPCEAIMIGRGGMEEIYDDESIERFSNRYRVKNNKVLY